MRGGVERKQYKADLVEYYYPIPCFQLVYTSIKVVVIILALKYSSGGLERIQELRKDLVG